MIPADPSAARRRRRVRSPIPLMVFLAGAVGVAGTTGVLRAADRRTDDIVRVEGLELVLTSVPDDGPAENYLLVGSDTREGVDPNAPDFGGIGDTSDVGGRRSDTIMILRREKDGGAALLSLPRDLWVEIAGTGESNRINSAYTEGPQRLASTITQSLGIPIHHYVEVDFVGFKRIIDEIGGVEICIEFATRDLHTGLALQPGCQKLDGVQSLAYARSRYYEEFRDGDWRIDPRADLGRIERQQLFMRAA
ncbi:MAG TPA: LCP family protein, partial [Ilumatobacteraceae bacterium]|nr:LCP family protein [Ilumatobacteraceae bacterium]